MINFLRRIFKNTKNTNTYDPFLGITKNKLETTIYTHSGTQALSFDIPTRSSLQRIIEAYRKTDHVPYIIYVDACNPGLPSETYKFNLQNRDFHAITDTDLLKNALIIKNDVKDSVEKNFIFSLSRGFDTPENSTFLWYENMMEILLSEIKSIKNHICMIMIPPNSMNKWARILFDNYVEKNPELHAQFLNIDSYAHLHQLHQKTPNEILFPIYHHLENKDSNMHYMDGATKVFPHVNKQHISQYFWDSHQAIYNVEDHSGVYYMKKDEVCIRKKGKITEKP